MPDPDLNSKPLVYVPVEPSGERRLNLDPRERIFVYTVHDGDILPDAFITPGVDKAQLLQSYLSMRDWGADHVADRLSAALGIGGYASARIARVLLDFNRFPGTTSKSASNPLDRFAIGEPFGSALAHSEKMTLLRVYDQMSDLIEDLVDGAFINIGIHTYDAHNESATKRPDVSIVSTPNTYLHHSRMPHGLFDPIYPDLLAESTCSRVLRDRISLNLERSGFRVSHNQPYPLPEGSIEVRAQVWAFFRYLKARFEAHHPETRDDLEMRLVWSMLLNTNLRSQEAEALRGYLHRYRRPATPQERAAFEGARDAYERISQFARESDVVTAYRRAQDRPSSMAIEVRKDLLVSFGDDGQPLPRTDQQAETAARIAGVIAEAIEIFLNTDRQAERAS